MRRMRLCLRSVGNESQSICSIIPQLVLPAHRVIYRFFLVAFAIQLCYLAWHSDKCAAFRTILRLEIAGNYYCKLDTEKCDLSLVRRKAVFKRKIMELGRTKNQQSHSEQNHSEQNHSEQSHSEQSHSEARLSRINVQHDFWYFVS